METTNKLSSVQKRLEVIRLAKMGKSDDALKILDDILEKDNNSENLMLKGKILVNKGETAKAKATFLEIQETDSLYQQAQMAAGRIIEYERIQNGILKKMSMFISRQSHLIMLSMIVLVIFSIIRIIMLNASIDSTVQNILGNQNAFELSFMNNVDSINNRINETALSLQQIDTWSIEMMKSHYQQLLKIDSLNKEFSQFAVIPEKVDSIKSILNHYPVTEIQTGLGELQTNMTELLKTLEEVKRQLKNMEHNPANNKP
jgi:tetratricopeptide (TPR) repeat protein